jgi:hypothetical protein
MGNPKREDKHTEEKKERKKEKKQERNINIEFMRQNIQ